MCVREPRPRAAKPGDRYGRERNLQERMPLPAQTATLSSHFAFLVQLMAAARPEVPRKQYALAQGEAAENPDTGGALPASPFRPPRP